MTAQVAASEPLDEDEAADRYAEVLAWMSGRLVAAVRAKDARAARVWLQRCLQWAPPPEWGAEAGECLILLLASQIPDDGDAQDRVGWLRDYGTVLGSDDLPVQDEIPGVSG